MRSSGILLHISSLPSNHGIGTFGRAAYEFADKLALANQRYWQVLPLSPTAYGDSPYQSPANLAGNPYFIDLDMLKEDGLLTDNEINSYDYGSDARCVDYGKIYNARYDILHHAYVRGFARDSAEVESFARENIMWINDYALFMAIKKYFGGKPWYEWDDLDIRRRTASAMTKYKTLLSDDINFYTYIQYLFFKQFGKLKAYLKNLGLKLIGDIPMYVALDSADTWANPKEFELDRDLRPIWLSGVPPDYFSKTGQLWGNPIYDWDSMKKNGYRWWMNRFNMASKLFDVLRVDHFRGFESYWRVPAGEKTAVNGEWVKGPGIEFINKVKSNFPQLDIIAEDLGILTKEVRAMLRESGFPGMSILQFAFAGNDSDYLPHHYVTNSVCYTGTHDNTTMRGWIESTSGAEREKYIKYLGLSGGEGYLWGVIRGGMGSVADTFIAQMQDYLWLDGSCRMNTPGTEGNNWTWRLLSGEFTDDLVKQIGDYALLYGRIR